jgi:hypothetical protein
MQMRTGTRVVALLTTFGALLGLSGVASAASPTAETLPPDTSLISDSYALLSGTLNPNGVNVVYRFDWGRTTAYGHTTPVTSAGNGKADVPVDISLDTLNPNTTYHYRLVVLPENSAEVDGADQQFTTTSALGLAFASAKVHVTSKGKAQVKVTSIGPPDDTAAGRLTLKSAVNGHPKTVGSVGYSLAVGKHKTLTVRLNKAGREALSAAGGTLKVVASAATTGVAKSVTKTLKLEA